MREPASFMEYFFEFWEASTAFVGAIAIGGYMVITTHKKADRATRELGDLQRDHVAMQRQIDSISHEQTSLSRSYARLETGLRDTNMSMRNIENSVTRISAYIEGKESNSSNQI